MQLCIRLEHPTNEFDLLQTALKNDTKYSIVMDFILAHLSFVNTQVEVDKNKIRNRFHVPSRVID